MYQIKFEILSSCTFCTQFVHSNLHKLYQAWKLQSKIVILYEAKIRTKKGTSGVRKLVNPVCLVGEQQESPRDSCEDWEANRIQKSLSLILNSIAITSRNLVLFDRHISFRFTDIYRYIAPPFFEFLTVTRNFSSIFLSFFWKKSCSLKIFATFSHSIFCLTLQWFSEFLCLRFYSILM